MRHLLTAGRPPPDRGSLEPRSSSEGAPRPQHSRPADNSISNSHRTMSSEPRQTLTARHAGSTTANQRTTNNSSPAEDVEKNVQHSTRVKNKLGFLHRARGNHLEHIPTINESLNAVLRQSCTFRRHHTWVWGTSADCSRAQYPFRVFTVSLD